MNGKVRFATLDGLRGLAAILVMCFHARGSTPLEVRGGYLAVDFFFALSGFVLAMGYEDRFRQGLSVRDFMILRLGRIYPMYFVGLLPCVAMGVLTPYALALLPDPNSPTALFPGNVPMWSLFYELVVNLGFAFLSVRAGFRGLAGILATSGALLLFLVFGCHIGVVRGPDWADMAIGITRTTFSFTVGVTIYRLRARAGLARRETWLALLPFGVLLLALLANPPIRHAWDIACIFFVLPLALWAGTNWELPWRRLGEAMGDMSYPLFCIHAPLIWGSFRYLFPNMELVFLFIIVLAWCLDRWVDRPARRAFASVFKPGFTKAAPA